MEAYAVIVSETKMIVNGWSTGLIRCITIVIQLIIMQTHFSVLLRAIQLTLVQRFKQLYFLIHYCFDNTRNVRAPNADRRSGASLLASWKVNFFWKHHLHSWTSVALNMCELNTT
jgi:hypothetical protein